MTAITASRSLGRIAQLSSGSAIGQVVTLVASPLLTRLYSPADFALLATFVAVVGPVSSAANARLDVVVMLPNEHADAGHVAKIGAAVGAVTGGVGALALLMWNPTASGIVVALLVGIAVFINSISALAIALATRFGHFQHLARSSVVRSFGVASSQLGLSAVPGGFGLVVGTVIGAIPGLAALGPSSLRFILSGTLKTGLSLVRGYLAYPKYLVPATLLNSTAALILATQLVFPGSVVGQLSVALRMLAVPIALVAASVGTVFTREIAVSRRPDDIVALYVSATKKLAIVGVPFYVGVGVASPWLFPLVFGEGWALAGVYAASICGAMGASFIMTAVSATPNFTGHPHVALGYQLGACLVPMVLAAIGAALVVEPLYFMWSYSVAMCLYQVAAWAIFRRLARSGATSVEVGKGAQ